MACFLGFVPQAAATVHITGVVRDTDGHPIASARVSCRGAGFTAGEWTNTDRAGRFHLRNLQPGTYSVTVTHPDYTPRTIHDISTGTKTVSAVLEGLAQIEGRVVDALTEVPIQSFDVLCVEILRDKTDLWHNDTVQHVENAAGRFRLDGIYTGDATVMVKTGAFVSSMVVPDLKEGETRRDVVVRIKTGATIRGVVRDTDGNPLSGILIYDDRVPHTWQEHHGNVVARTAADGTFAVEGLAPRTHTLSAWYPDYAPTSLRVDASLENPANAVMTLGRGGAVKGRVRLGGKPLPNARIWARPDVAFGVTFSNGATDASGRYDLTGVPAGPVRLYLETQDGTTPFATRRAVIREATVHHDETTTWDCDLIAHDAALAGVITRGGEPAAGATVRAWRNDAGKPSEFFTTVTHQDGRYALNGIPAGPLNVRVSFSASDEAGAVSSYEATHRVNTVAAQSTRLDIAL